jgi:hypothetical protein
VAAAFFWSAIRVAGLIAHIPSAVGHQEGPRACSMIAPIRAWDSREPAGACLPFCPCSLCDSQNRPHSDASFPHGFGVNSSLTTQHHKAFDRSGCLQSLAVALPESESHLSSAGGCAGNKASG